MDIAIIGAGNGGHKLMQLFYEMDNVNIKMIVDQDFNSPGILMAKEVNIKYTDDLMKTPNDVDLIIEATGNQIVKDIIKDKFEGISVIDSEAAALIMSVVDKQKEVTNKLDEQLKVINETSLKLENEINNVSGTINTLHNITKKLNDSSDESKTYISKSNEMTSSINKITQHIKILGLNANIEAARAGEHGRGFSVVATEVQKMSDETTRFASEISNLLKSLSDENENIIREITSLNTVATEQTLMSDTLNNVVSDLNNNYWFMYL